IRLDGSRAIQFALRVFKLTFVEKNQGAIVADDDERCRIEMNQTVITAQRPIVFAIQTMQSGLYKMDHSFVWRLASHARDLVAGPLLLPPPKQDEHHQHSCLDDVWIDRQRVFECAFSLFEVFDSPESLKNTVHVASSQAVIC